MASNPIATDAGPAPGPAAAPAGGRAVAVIGTLVGLGLADGLGRWLAWAVLPTLAEAPDRGGIGLDGAAAGWVMPAALLGAGATGPILGWLGDRMRRPPWLALGAGLAGLAAIGSGLASTPAVFLACRALTGLGEAALAGVGLTLLVDAVPRRRRATALALPALAAAVGGALGLALGGVLAASWGWRAALIASGVPNAILAALVLVLPDPLRGATEPIEPARLRSHERSRPTGADYSDLMVNSSFTYSIFGLAFSAFALDGLRLWGPALLAEVRGLGPDAATRGLAVVAAIAATVGLLLGGLLVDRLAARRPRAMFVAPGLALLAAAPLAAGGLLAGSPAVALGGLGLALMLAWAPAGPCRAILAGVAPPNLRGVAFGAALAGSHLLGGLWAGPLIGWTARTFGGADLMASPVGAALARLGAVPVRLAGGAAENPLAGLLLVVPALVVAGLVLLAGVRHLPRELALMLAKVRSARVATPAASPAAPRTP